MLIPNPLYDQALLYIDAVVIVTVHIQSNINKPH
jgi:hypothetical protein